MDKETVLGIIRHVLSAIGGILAARGYLSSGEVETIVGLGLVIAGMVMSYLEKRQRKEAEAGRLALASAASTEARLAVADIAAGKLKEPSDVLYRDTKASDIPSSTVYSEPEVKTDTVEKIKDAVKDKKK